MQEVYSPSVSTLRECPLVHRPIEALVPRLHRIGRNSPGPCCYRCRQLHRVRQTKHRLRHVVSDCLGRGLPRLEHLRANLGGTLKQRLPELQCMAEETVFVWVIARAEVLPVSSHGCRGFAAFDPAYYQHPLHFKFELALVLERLDEEICSEIHNKKMRRYYLYLSHKKLEQ
jgi:hypothetical protein